MEEVINLLLMKKILCIGEALIDMICTDRNKALSDGENFLKKAGGAPMNVAAAIAALGGDVMVSAKVGDDPFGQHYHIRFCIPDGKWGARLLLQPWSRRYVISRRCCRN